MTKREELARVVGSTLCGEEITIPNGHDYRVVDAILDAMMEPGVDGVDGIFWYYSCHICGGPKESWQNIITHIKEDQ